MDYGNKLLFENINLSFGLDTKAGLVGRNGTGKTTLFKIISKEIQNYKGDVFTAKDYKVGYFAQDHNFSSQELLWNWLYQSNLDILNKKQELIENERLLTLGPSEKLLKQYDKLQIEFDLLGGFTYEQEIKSMLITFGFKPEDFYRSIDDFSGGEKTRIRLIRILLNKYNFILFDEPTNHLDLVTVDWFINYLKNSNCGYLIISHDRYLLDQTVNKIYELVNQKIETFSGNYSSYQIQAVERDKVLQKQYIQQQKLIEKTQDFINKNLTRASTSNRAKSRIKMLNRMEKIELTSKAKDLRLKINSSHRSGNDIFRLKNIKIGYDNLELASDINLNLHYQDKVCLIGANGSGKTTLLKILNDEIEPLSGDLWTGYNLSVGYYDQEHIDLDNELSDLDTIWNLVPGETFGYVMTYLARFGFSEDMIEQKVSSLSGGEKSRLFLAQLIHEKPNLLILDEPTNHLDISMIQSLEKALKNYDGTLIIVSHDRYFIRAITDNYWVFADKTIYHAKENFEQIMEKLNPYNKEKKAKSAEKISLPSAKEKKQNTFLLDQAIQKIDEIEKKIRIKEAEIFEMHTLFNDPKFYAKQENIDKANQQIYSLEKEIKSMIQQKEILENEYLQM